MRVGRSGGLGKTALADLRASIPGAASEIGGDDLQLFVAAAFSRLVLRASESS
jgi:hypothetical protein